METTQKALNNAVNLRTGPTKEEILVDIATLERLVSELERPQYREFIQFAVAWEKFGRDLAALQLRIKERLAEEPVSPVNEFLKKLIKTEKQRPELMSRW